MVSGPHPSPTPSGRAAAEGADAEDERRSGALRAGANRREGLARLAGQVAARRSRVDAGREEVEPAGATQIAEAEPRSATALASSTALETQVNGVEAGEEELDAEHEAAEAAPSR